MKKWSEEAWDVARPTYLKIIEHPFVEELARGTLAADKFLFYLRQDSLYLAHYSRVLTHIASRLTEKEHIAAFIRFASDGIEVEEALHGSFLKGDVPAPEEISPTCLLYTSVLQAQATAPVEVEAAAVLPCFWVYQQVGGRSSPGSREWESLCTVDRDLRRSLLHRSDFAGYRNLRRTGRKNRAGNPAPDDRHLPALYQDGVAVLGQRLVSGKLENIKSVHSSKCANNLINKINYEKTL